jgi:hypothetical protein
MTKESPSPILPNVSTGFPPERETRTSIKGNDLTLTFTKTRGNLSLDLHEDTSMVHAETGAVIGDPTMKSMRLPLWAIREIRDYCAKEFPPLGPPNEGYL